MFTDTFAGIEPGSVPAFVAFQLVGGALAVAVIAYLFPDARRVAEDVVVPSEPVSTRARSRQEIM
jgi:hypothetical protein